MDWLAAPFVLLLGLVGEILKLSLSKTTLSRDAVFQRENKFCLVGYIVVGILLIYSLAAGKSITNLLWLVAWAVGIHMGARIWKDRG